MIKHCKVVQNTYSIIIITGHTTSSQISVLLVLKHSVKLMIRKGMQPFTMVREKYIIMLLKMLGKN